VREWPKERRREEAVDLRGRGRGSRRKIVLVTDPSRKPAKASRAVKDTSEIAAMTTYAEK
jgi:hypothetical protein